MRPANSAAKRCHRAAQKNAHNYFGQGNGSEKGVGGKTGQLNCALYSGAEQMTPHIRG